jgi:hypothetical protein
MKTKYTSQSRSAGYALILVMIMCAASLLIMAAVMNRTSTVSKLNNRNNQYTLCCTVAGAATEKVFARMAYDFQSYALGKVITNFVSGLYATNIPTAAENSYWGNFVFSDAQGHANSTYVGFLTNYSGALPSQYTNLFTKTAPIYRIVSNVSLAGSPDIIGTAQEDVLLALLPITTYAIFYNGPLEFTQTADMTVRGRTHANDIICVGTGIGFSSNPPQLNFIGPVTATKTVGGPTRDGLTPSPWNENTFFNAGYITNNASVTVAMTMTNSHAIIDIPPPPTVESPTSQQGILRLYNQAQVLILVTNLPVSGKPPTPQVTFTLQNSDLGLVPGADGNKTYYTYIWTNYVYTTNITSPYKWFTNSIFTNLVGGYATEPHGIEKFLSLTLTNTFTDKREYKTNMFVTQIDVHGYTDWLGTNGFQTPKFTSDTPPTILYVADQRNVGTNKLSVVRLVNGATLPNNYGLGWSVATPNPLYVKGNYNVTADGIHFAYIPDSTTNSGTCVPAALLCDAITILSSSFNDSTSAGIDANACATGTVGSNTVNAAVITGNVPSTGTSATTFSGGVHNLMRMLEDWTGDKLILNTSIVVLYASQMATNQFRNPVDWTNPVPINPYYEPPTRQWGFDPNFNNPAKQPPGVPTALVPIRFNWTVPPPGTVTNNIGNW